MEQRQLRLTIDNPPLRQRLEALIAGEGMPPRASMSELAEAALLATTDDMLKHALLDKRERELKEMRG